MGQTSDAFELRIFFLAPPDQVSDAVHRAWTYSRAAGFFFFFIIFSNEATAVLLKRKTTNVVLDSTHQPASWSKMGKYYVSKIVKM